MQGSLWRQRLEEREARQLTDGPGYDYQPDWSPDGRRVVYASYRDDAIELRLLDLESGTLGAAGGQRRGQHRAALVTGRRAESPTPRPRTRAAGTSSSWTCAEGGASGEPVRISRGSRQRPAALLLPQERPVPLADLVARRTRADSRLQSRAHLGLRRLLAGGGQARRRSEREIHNEETTWKARPDWSRDGPPRGLRLVPRPPVASALAHDRRRRRPPPAHLRRVRRDRRRAGRRPATASRTSSNEGGNTSLWVLDVSSGARREVAGRAAAATCGRRDPAHRRSSTSAGGAAAGARLGHRRRRQELSHRLTPGIMRTTASTGASGASSTATSTLTGLATLTLPAGAYTVEVSRGPEYRVVDPVGRGRRTAVTTPLRVALGVLDDLRGARLVQRRPPRPHELRRRLSQRPHPAARSRPGRRISTWWRT